MMTLFLVIQTKPLAKPGLPAGNRLLDAGAGELKNRQYCGHQDYVSRCALFRLLRPAAGSQGPTATGRVAHNARRPQPGRRHGLCGPLAHDSVSALHHRQ